MDPQTIEKGSKVTRPETDPTLADKAFIGWFLAEQNNSFDFNTALTEDTTIYAKWTDATAGLTYEVISGKEELTVLGTSSNNLKGVSIYIPAKATKDNKVYSVTEIKKEAFTSCEDIVKIYIPQSITKIAYDAFDYTKATGIYYGGTTEQFDKCIEGTRTEVVDAQSITVNCSNGTTIWWAATILGE